jgi:23S rRNA-/tRNA-specific pseudouridylate synthase
VERTYQAIVLGQPQRPAGRVETNIGRDVGDRKKMAAFGYMSNRRARAGRV